MLPLMSQLESKVYSKLKRVEHQDEDILRVLMVGAIPMKTEPLKNRVHQEDQEMIQIDLDLQQLHDQEFKMRNKKILDKKKWQRPLQQVQDRIGKNMILI
jgi:hypothetical protein